MQLLVSAPWPGNVRQLLNVIEQAVALAPDRGDPGVAGAPGAGCRRHRAHAARRGAPRLRARLPGAHPEDHRRQRHQGGAPGRAATAPSSTACSSATRSSRACSRAMRRTRTTRSEPPHEAALRFLLHCSVRRCRRSRRTPGPEELVKKMTEDVLAAIKSDKQLAAGDRQKALKLAEEKILPHVDFEEATRLAVGRAWSAGDARSRRRSWSTSSATCWCAPTRTPSAPTRARR